MALDPSNDLSQWGRYGSTGYWINLSNDSIISDAEYQRMVAEANAANPTANWVDDFSSGLRNLSTGETIRDAYTESTGGMPGALDESKLAQYGIQPDQIQSGYWDINSPFWQNRYDPSKTHWLQVVAENPNPQILERLASSGYFDRFPSFHDQADWARLQAQFGTDQNQGGLWGNSPAEWLGQTIAANQDTESSNRATQNTWAASVALAPLLWYAGASAAGAAGGGTTGAAVGGATAGGLAGAGNAAINSENVGEGALKGAVIGGASGAAGGYLNGAVSGTPTDGTTDGLSQYPQYAQTNTGTATDFTYDAQTPLMPAAQPAQDPTFSGTLTQTSPYAYENLGNIEAFGSAPPQAYSGPINSNFTPTNAQTNPQTGAMQTAGGAAAGTALSRILDGTASTADYLSLLGTGAATGLGIYGANQQAKSLEQLTAQYMAMGAPSRARYETSFLPGFSMANEPGYQDALDQTTKSFLHKASIAGNPADSPNAWTQTLRDVNAGFAYPALQDYRRMNANAGGLSRFADAAPGVATGAIGAQKGVYDAVGYGLGNVFNPPTTLEQLLKQMRTT